MPEAEEANETDSDALKTFRNILFMIGALCVVGVIVGFLFNSLGYYEVCGSDTAIEVNSARLRTRVFFFWIRLRETVQDSEVSRTLRESGNSKVHPADWKVMTTRSWPVRFFGGSDFGKVGPILSQIDNLLMDDSTSKSERERIGLAFIKLLTASDFKGLQDLVQSEVANRSLKVIP